MMEVKQNTGLDLNDLLLTKSPNNTNNTEDDILGESMTGNCKAKIVTDPPNMANENSAFDTEDVIDLCDMDVDDHISPEIEDALLAGDDLIENKNELPNGHEKTLDNMRVTHSPDDLDNLLSKLNDIVDDVVNDSTNSLIKDDLFTNGVIDDLQIGEEKNDTVDIPKDLNDLPPVVDQVEENAKFLGINDEILPSLENDKSGEVQDDESKVKETNNQEAAVETPHLNETISIPEESEASDNNEANIENTLDEKIPEINEKDSEIKAPDLEFSENDSNPSSLKPIDISSDTEVEKEEAEEEKVEKEEKNKNDLPKQGSSEIPTTCLDDDDVSIIPSHIDEDDDIDAGACAENDNNENLEQNAKSSAAAKNIEEETFPLADDSIVLIDETFSEESQINSKDLKESSSNLPLNTLNNNPDDSVVCIDDSEMEEKSSLKKPEETNKDSTESSDSKEENLKSPKEAERSHEDDLSSSKENKDKSPKAVEVAASNTDSSNTFIIDNSDNAQDDFSNEKVPVPISNPKEVLEDNDSNNSSSSNLLQESKTVSDLNEVEEISEENDVDNDEEEAEDDVELIEDETPATENENEDEKETAPPAKRARLSDAEDSTDVTVALSPEEKTSEQVAANVEEEDSTEKIKPIEITEDSNSKDNSETLSNKVEASSQVSLKRPHEAIESCEAVKDTNEDLSENSTKKPKTEENLDIKDNKMENETKNIIQDKDEDTPVVKDEPIADKKAPEVGFKYKYVPSEISIPLYPPPKKPDSSTPSLPLDFLKRFRKSFDKMTKDDLEALVMQKVVEAIVYKSEFAEMRTLIEKQEKVITAHRSKITELSKQFRDLEMVHNRVVKDIQTRNSQLIMPVKITRAVGLQVYLTTKKNEIPVNPTPSNSRSTATTAPLQTPPATPAPPQRNQTNNPSVQISSNQQRPAMHGSTSIQKVTIGSGSPLTSTPNGTPQRRVGCVQKVTPQRPMPQGLTMTSSPAPSTPQRILNKNSPPVVPTQLQRNRVSVQEILQQQQQQRGNPNNNNYRHPAQNSQPQQQHQTTIQRMASNNTTMRPYQPNQNSTPSQQFRRSDPSLGGVQSNITTAKAKEKSFIDLTDEDDATESSPIITNNVAARRPVPAQPNRVFNTNQAANRTRTPQHRQNNIPSSPMVGSTSVTKVNISANHNMLRYKSMQHPAPLPAAPAQSYNSSLKLPPPKPTIRISNLDNGIVISWSIDEPMDNHADCTNYQIYAYQETSAPPSVDSWHHVGTVKAMLLPMAVTLTQFQEGQRYFFAVRAVDAHQRYGPFSEPKTWG